MPFRFDKLTIKAQEAVARPQELAAGAENALPDETGEAALIREAKRRLASDQPRRASADVLARLKCLDREQPR